MHNMPCALALRAFHLVGTSPDSHSVYCCTGELAINLARLDSVREDGEIKGERALRDARAEERERDR